MYLYSSLSAIVTRYILHTRYATNRAKEPNRPKQPRLSKRVARAGKKVPDSGRRLNTWRIRRVLCFIIASAIVRARQTRQSGNGCERDGLLIYLVLEQNHDIVYCALYGKACRANVVSYIIVVGKTMQISLSNERERKRGGDRERDGEKERERQRDRVGVNKICLLKAYSNKEHIS